MTTHTTPISQQAASPAEQQDLDVQNAASCVVGGVPAGAVLAILLARRGIGVTLLEAHGDFDRDFRGDTLNPSVMENMAELGLADRLLELHHPKLPALTLEFDRASVAFADFRLLKTDFPYITMMPQTDFLEFVTGEATRYPNFRLLMGASVRELVEKDGEIRGVRYRNRNGLHELRTLLTVGSDGRFSRVRRLAGFESIKTFPPIVVLNKLRKNVADLRPEVADRMHHLKEWNQVSVLSVEPDRLPKWHRPDLMIGEADHVMSSIAGMASPCQLRRRPGALIIEMGGPAKHEKEKARKPLGEYYAHLIA